MLIDDLGALAVSAGLAIINQSLFFGVRAVIPADATWAYSFVDTGGGPPEYVQNQVLPAYEFASAQLMTRAKDPAVARVKAAALFNVVCAVHNQFLNTTVWYLWVRPLQAPFDFGLDERERARIVFNVIALKRP